MNRGRYPPRSTPWKEERPAKTRRAKARAKKRVERRLDARPDHADFRDRLYLATLVNVPAKIPLSEYRERKVPVLDQGEEGACTGFGLATVAHYLLRTRRGGSSSTRVSPRMFYEMAKRYDEWPGTRYEGSSARRVRSR